MNNKLSAKKVFMDGIIYKNPVLVQLLGICPTLAVSTSLKNGVGMGLSVTAVLIFSNFIISLLRKFIPQKIRIASYIIIIAGFVSAIDLLIQAFVPSLSTSLGLYIPLIVVNCIIFARAESFASSNGVFISAFDGLSNGLGFTAALCIISAIREILGNGTIWDIPLFGASFEPALMMVLPCGGFLTLGIAVAIAQFIQSKISKKEKAK